MEWERETRQKSLILKIDFDKELDQLDWSIIYLLFIYLRFVLQCVSMMNTLFKNASTFVFVSKEFYPLNYLHHSILYGCPLAPYLYVLGIDALGYFL